MVMSEGGEWSYPIKVFADSELETFVPDITSQGWISWHIAEFREKGTYVTYLYIYHRKSRNTGRETVYVDTRSGTAVIVRPFLAPFRVSLSKAPLELSKSITRITALVMDGDKRFHGMTVQESILKEKSVVARMALCSGPGNPNPDCRLSDSDFQAKHPIYARTPPKLIPGAVPGVNCGIGTDKSCCCANDSATSNSSALSSVAKTNVISKGQNKVPSPARSDGQIEMDLIHALDASKALKNDRITAATIHGEVSLSGVVSGAADRELAEFIAAHVAGVTKVNNNLNVSARANPF
jgi:hypothetical protein